MGGYIVNFTVYTMAMIGLICFAVFVYKKITDGTMRSNSTKFLSIEETMSLNPRKTLHVVRAGNEKFLIASDIDRTTLISKLEWNKTPEVRTLDRFKDIPLVNQEFQEQQKVSYETPPKPTKTVSKQVIHLEDVNPQRRRKVGAGRNLDTLYNIPEKTDTKSFSPMKEMAKRINEL